MKIKQLFIKFNILIFSCFLCLYINRINKFDSHEETFSNMDCMFDDIRSSIYRSYGLYYIDMQSNYFFDILESFWQCTMRKLFWADCFLKSFKGDIFDKFYFSDPITRKINTSVGLYKRSLGGLNRVYGQVLK